MTDVHEDGVPARDTVPDYILQSFAAVFGARAGAITRETVSADVEGWDSMANISLLLEIESRGKIRFKASEILDLANVGQLIDLVQAKLRAA